MNNVHRPEDEIKFENFLKSPLRFFGLIYPYFIAIIIIGGMYWVYNMDAAFKNNLKPQILLRDTVQEPIAMKKGSIMAGVDVKIAGKSTPELVAKGQELFKANCSSCHGDDGSGNGIAGKGLNPAPRNFHSADGWKNGRKLSEIWKTLEEGIPGGGMVSYNYLQVTDRFALIHYIHSLMDNAPKDSESELAQLDMTYKLSEGKASSNTIPVEKAESVLSADFKSIEVQAGIIEKNLIYFRNEPGAKLILDNSKDNHKIIISLLRSDQWKGSYETFTREIASNLNTNGFRASVLRLNNTELQLMHEFLLKTFSQI
ncbi:MAG: cytochrome c [Candidatus Kapabacteria bacterium]|nr:cytochrome c [Candidatus Kapabacteria bacterium]